MAKINNIGTFTLSVGSYTILADDGISSIAFKLATGGAATIGGAAFIKSIGGASTPIALVVGEATIVATNNENEFVDNLQIVVSSGTVLVITNQ